MLTIYRRHQRRCKHRAAGRDWRQCDCPIHVDGFLGGIRIRKALDTRSWQLANAMVRDWEAEGRLLPEEPAPEPVTLADSQQRFLTEARGRNLSNGTIYKYELLLRRMQEFAQRRGLNYLCQFDLDRLSDFRAGWQEGPSTSLKNLERLRAFFRFAQKRKWIGDNPANEMKPPKVERRQTMPFTKDEWKAILEALPAYAKRAGVANGQRLRGFVLLLRYSGMRIGDAVRFRLECLEGARLSYYTQKTNQLVVVCLPSEVTQALRAIPHTSNGYLFWSGASTLHSAVGKWQRRLKNLFQLAAVRNGHAHRFRDTFAHDLAHNGKMTLQELAHALGHKSTRVTERYYSPWVAERQERLEDKMKVAWSRDPFLREHDTYMAHEQPRRVN
jgi:integrase/recombinase XerD